MVFWASDPWYMKTPTLGISSSLYMICQTHIYGILNPLPMIYRTPYAPWIGSPIYHG
jgi:hypothetical protein